ncbi:TRIC cation channel family protein, partial [Acinetobacter baumannii]
LTGVFGGVLRDVLCNEIPLVFRTELYAVVSLLTGAGYLTLLALGIGESVSVLACLAGGFLLRLLAIRYGLEMPKFDYRDRD